jgi:hypothetical protein
VKPTVGRIVHYVSYGTPGGEYRSECRAAIVTSETTDWSISLCVLNPDGLFFNHGVEQDEGTVEDVPVNGPGAVRARTTHRGGTWHWPEREEN